MKIIGKKCYFTIYGNWRDRPYECKYLVDSFLQNKDDIIINLNNGKSQIIINDYQKLKKGINCICVKEASKITINWFAFKNQKEINECSTTYRREQNLLIKKISVLKDPPVTMKLPIKGSYAFKIFT